MSSADPFLAASSMTQLFPRTLGPAASAAADAPSPSRALGALLDGVSRHMKGSKELVEQARIATKEHGDIGKLYHDDGARVAAAANGKNNQQGRRPALGLKRSRFTIKAPTDNPVQNVDFSVLHNIEDPDEYFLALEKLEKAEKEIKRLRGEAPTEAIGNHRAINPSEMRPGLLRRKSVHSYKFTLSTDIPDAMKAPFSQTDTITESQFTQDDVHASSPEMTKELVPSRSSQHAIPDVSVRKDSFAEKDESSTLSYLLSSFKNLDEAEEENLLRETLQIKEISVGKLCLPDFNVSVDMPASSSTSQKNPMSGHTPERNVPGGHLDRILQLEKHIFAGDALKDKHADPIDDESDGSPESVVREGSLVQGSSVLVDSTVGEVSAIRETQSPSTKSPEHVLEPEPNPPKSATIDEGLEGSSPIGVHTDIEPAKEKGASCSRSVSLEENDTTMDYLVSSPCHQEGDSTEALASTPSGNVSPLQQRDANSEHQEMAGADAAQGLEHTLLTDKPVHTSEIPPEDTYRQNRSDLHHANIEELAANISNALSPSKGEEQKGKAKKQPSKRGKKVTGEPSNLEIPSPDFDPENQPHMQDTDVEQQTTHASNSPSPSKDKRQKEARRRNKKQDLNKRKSLVDAGLTWQSGVRRSTRIRSRPLQHWLGERFVYGRIHGTMATVIGVKSLSPSQEGKAAMRVKSFVPEQYSDLLAKSARY